MKTLIIFNEIEKLSYAIVDGDYSRFNGVMVNANATGFESEFCDWFFDAESGEQLIETKEDKSLVENKDWDMVAICTFLP